MTPITNGSRRNRGRGVRAMACLAAVLAFPAGAQAGQGPDFNGDNQDDVAVGVSSEALSGFSGAGAVNVIYGETASGLGLFTDQFWHQDRLQIKGSLGEFDLFGEAVATGDFDGDGKDDMAVGVPREDVGGKPDAGAVNVIYGGSAGLTGDGNQIFTEDKEGLPTDANNNEYFGTAVVSGDFDNDGRDDLAVGTRSQNVGTVKAAGQVVVLYGTAGDGLKAAGSQVFNQASIGVLGDAEEGDHFGEELAAGDFNGDGRDDLAVGTPDDSEAANLSGSVNVLYGNGPAGLTTTGSDLWTQGSPGIGGVAEVGDGFGAALAAGDFGDFGDDGRGDLAIGVPGEDAGQVGSAGAVNVIYGSAIGLDANGDQLIDQNTAGVFDDPEVADGFGAALAAGDLDDVNGDDLLIGTPGEAVVDVAKAGTVHAIYSDATDLDPTTDEVWSQDTFGIADSADPSDVFGSALTVGDVDEDGVTDAVVGAPGETLPGANAAGAIQVIHGVANTGLTHVENQFLTQDSLGIKNKAEPFDSFGDVLGIKPPA